MPDKAASHVRAACRTEELYSHWHHAREKAAGYNRAVLEALCFAGPRLPPSPGTALNSRAGCVARWSRVLKSTAIAGHTLTQATCRCDARRPASRQGVRCECEGSAGKRTHSQPSRAARPERVPRIPAVLLATCRCAAALACEGAMVSNEVAHMGTRLNAVSIAPTRLSFATRPHMGTQLEASSTASLRQTVLRRGAKQATRATCHRHRAQATCFRGP